MVKYDAVSKRMVQAHPQDIIHLVFGRGGIEVRAILETEHPRVETRRMDSLILVRIDGEEALVHTEFQTADSTDTPMPIRMASYIIRIIEQYRLPVYSFVIYLRPNAGRRDKGRFVQRLPGHRVFVQYKVIRLSEIEGRDIVAGGHQGLLPFTPLMKRPAGMAPEEWLRQCIRRADDVSLDHATKVDFLGGLALLSGLVYEPSTITRIISQEGLMDAIMRESSFAQYLKEQFKEQFLEQGIEQGIEQGGRECAVEAILDVLEIRFGLVPAHPFAAPIAEIDDLQRLKWLHRAAVQVDNLDDFQRLLNGDA